MTAEQEEVFRSKVESVYGIIFRHIQGIFFLRLADFGLSV